MKKRAPRHSANQARRVSVRDIARVCGVSAMTVSRAINNAYGVHPKTRERILEAAREMGYIQNRLASNLSRRNTCTVGVIIPNIVQTMFPSVVQSLEGALRAGGYHLFLCCSYDKPEREMGEAQALLEHCVDGIVLAPSSIQESMRTVRLIEEHRCPLVLIDRAVPGAGVDFVGFDDYRGARDLVARMIEAGYRRIAHLTGPAHNWSSRERLRGYRNALKKAGIRYDRSIVLEAPLPRGETAMASLLDNDPTVDAVFCWNDPLAIVAWRVLRDRGMAVPGDIGLAGFSGIVETELLETPLTTVMQDSKALAGEAAALLLSRMGENPSDKDPVRRTIATEVLWRRSTERPANSE